MPRAQKRKSNQRAAPYDLRSHSDMAPQPPTHLIVSPDYQSHYQEWDHSPYDQNQMISNFPAYMPQQMSLQPPLQSHSNISMQQQQHHPPERNSTSAPWSDKADKILVDCKRRNMPWDAIQAQYFPHKSANACRKRHERIEQKRRATDWDEERLAAAAVAYKEMRKEIWTPLARRLGEKWEHVERICMAEGLKPLINRAAHHSRQISNGSDLSGNSGLEDSSPLEEFPESFPEMKQHDHDDSGIGIGMGMDTRRSSRRMSDRGVALDQGQLQNIMQPYRGDLEYREDMNRNRS